MESAENADMKSVVILDLHKIIDFLQSNSLGYSGKDYQGMPLWVARC